MEPQIIDGTAAEVIAQLARLPAAEHVRAIVGRPSLTAIARKLQQTAATNGMTDAVYDELMASLKHGG